MSRWEDELLDPFLAEVPEDADVRALVEALAPPATAPAPAARDALLGAATSEGRFERFVPTTAALLDVDAAVARRLLELVGTDAWYTSRIPDVSLIDLEGGPRVQGAITGFVRMPAGAAFPEHEHLGPETVFVLQGSFVDEASGAIVRPGERAEQPTGSTHRFTVRPGPDLVYLVVGQTGIRIGDQTLGPDDPRV